MPKDNSTKIVSLVITILLIAFIAPIGIDALTTNQITKSRTTSLNDSVFTTLNESSAYDDRTFILQSTYTNYTDVWVNTSADLGFNRTIWVQLTASNISAVTIINASLYYNNGSLLIADFNDTTYGFSANLTFNTLYNKSIATGAGVNSISVRFNATITSNCTITVNVYTTETYTDSETDNLNAIYQVLPILVIVSLITGIVGYAVKKKDE